MSETIKKLPHSHVQFELVFDEAVMKKWKPQAIAKLSEEANIKGFRKGHIPENVLVEKFGAEYVQACTIDMALPGVYADFVKEHKIHVVAKPKVEEKGKNPPTFEVTVAVYPEVEVGKYEKIKVPQEKVKVSKDDIKKVMENIQQRSSEFKKVDRAAKEGDKVEIDFDGFDADGKPVPNTSSKKHPLLLGKTQFLADFEDHVVGMKAGEDKEFTMTFPKDYHAEAMRGKPITFKVKLHEVQEVVLPEIDEAFIEKATGKKQSKADFEKEVEAQIQAEKEREVHAKREQKLVEEVIKITKIDPPEEMVHDELHHLLDDQKRHVAQQGASWEAYLKHIKKTDEQLHEEMKPQALNRLTARLAFQVILDKEKIEVDEKDVKKEVEAIKAYYGQHPDAKKIDEMYKKGAQMYEELKRRLQMNKLVDKLLAA